jgi:hypothetical protein
LEQELRLFLNALYLPHDRLHFFPILSDGGSQQCLADPSLIARLKELGLTTDHFDHRTCQTVERPIRWPPPRSTHLGSKRFDATIARLRELNHLGYDILVCPNPLGFNQRCDQAVIGVRCILLDNGGKNPGRWLEWLDAHRRHALVAVQEGNRIQVCVRIEPLRNHRLARHWKQLPPPHLNKPVDWPSFSQVAEKVMRFAEHDGLAPERRALCRPSGLIQCPGFVRHGGQMVRLLHPMDERLDAASVRLESDPAPASITATPAADRPAPTGQRRPSPRQPLSTGVGSSQAPCSST